ncbi:MULTISPECIES: hypothetical protein [Flammeovirga]|uniref:Uncharacterized protein n=1 Tax=Flammeovirga agarivorans TaxID=2726742 RepID=A0A7X8SGP3_9BACT|nr:MULTISPECIES: hypothetical protein [Flammeovirga]NLR89925.1 hypothetical protein [Flammeovirga agarivorans]
MRKFIPLHQTILEDCLFISEKIESLRKTNSAILSHFIDEEAMKNMKVDPNRPQRVPIRKEMEGEFVKRLNEIQCLEGRLDDLKYLHQAIYSPHQN